MGVNRSSSPRRAWYPSGPRLDGSSSSSYSAPAPDINPNPSNYKILLAEERGKFLIIKLQYPNCTNFEGNKILVYKGVKLIDLVNQKLIDPHFFENKKYVSPIARFIPTEEGLRMAQIFVQSMK